MIHTADFSLYLCQMSQWCQIPQAQLLTGLSADEQRQCAHFSQPQRRHGYALSRYLLRQRLAATLNCSPAGLRFRLGSHGRPELEHGEFCFNLSHSGDWLALALGPCPLGVDIEVTRPTRQLLAIAKRFFTAREYHALASLPNDAQESAFLELWCLKEALLKAHGGGLQAGLARFCVQHQPPRLVHNQLDQHDYQLASWRLAGAQLALAVQAHQPLPVLTPQWLTP